MDSNMLSLSQRVFSSRQRLLRRLFNPQYAQNQALKIDGVPAMKGSVRVPTIYSAVKLIRND